MSLVLWECKKALGKGAEKPQKTLAQLQWLDPSRLENTTKKRRILWLAKHSSGINVLQVNLDNQCLILALSTIHTLRFLFRNRRRSPYLSEIAIS